MLLKSIAIIFGTLVLASSHERRAKEFDKDLEKLLKETESFLSATASKAKTKVKSSSSSTTSTLRSKSSIKTSTIPGADLGELVFDGEILRPCKSGECDVYRERAVNMALEASKKVMSNGKVKHRSHRYGHVNGSLTDINGNVSTQFNQTSGHQVGSSQHERTGQTGSMKVDQSTQAQPDTSSGSQQQSGTSKMGSMNSLQQATSAQKTGLSGHRQNISSSANSLNISSQRQKQKRTAAGCLSRQQTGFQRARAENLSQQAVLQQQLKDQAALQQRNNIVQQKLNCPEKVSKAIHKTESNQVTNAVKSAIAQAGTISKQATISSVSGSGKGILGSVKHALGQHQVVKQTKQVKKNDYLGNQKSAVMMDTTPKVSMDQIKNIFDYMQKVMKETVKYSTSATAKGQNVQSPASTDAASSSVHSQSAKKLQTSKIKSSSKSKYSANAQSSKSTSDKVAQKALVSSQQQLSQIKMLMKEFMREHTQHLRQQKTSKSLSSSRLKTNERELLRAIQNTVTKEEREQIQKEKATLIAEQAKMRERLAVLSKQEKRASEMKSNLEKERSSMTTKFADLEVKHSRERQKLRREVKALQEKLRFIEQKDVDVVRQFKAVQKILDLQQQSCRQMKAAIRSELKQKSIQRKSSDAQRKSASSLSASASSSSSSKKVVASSSSSSSSSSSYQGSMQSTMSSRQVESVIVKRRIPESVQ